ARALATMSRAAAEATSPVEIRIADGKSHAGFVAQVGEFRVQVTARLLEGPYPNYEQVIPKDNPRSLTVARSDLMEAVDIVASHADSNTQQVRFSLRGSRLAVSSATADFGAGEQKVDAEYQGEDMDIGYNARYLLQTLRNIPTEKVVFRLKTALSAGIVEPVGALAQADEELLCLVMPLRLPDVAELEPREPVGGDGEKERRMKPLAALRPGMLQELGLAQAAEGWRAVADWPAVAGTRIAGRTRAVAFRDGALIVEVEGSAWMHELGFLKPELVRNLNRHLGADVVR